MMDRIAEFKLLAAIVDQPEIIHTITEQIFTEERRSLFEGMRQAYLTYGEITTEGVQRFYQRELPGEIDAVRGVRADSVLDHLAALATRRTLAEAADRLARLSAVPNPDMAQVTAALRLPPVYVSQDTTLAPGINKFLSDLQRKRSGKYKYLRTGLRFLDDRLGGEWPRQEVSIIAAGAGTGKTAVYCNTMLNMATMPESTASLLFSLEMSRSQLVQRHLANLCSINGLALRNGMITDEEVRRIEETLPWFQNLPMFIEERGGLSLYEILNIAEQHVNEFGVEWIGIDYIQLVKHNAGTGNQVNDLGDIVKRCKEFAKRRNVHVSLLSQLSRGNDSNSNMLDRLRGSGEIGEAADVVIAMVRGEAMGDMHGIYFDFVKNRNGPIGGITVPFLPMYQRYDNMYSDERDNAAVPQAATGDTIRLG